MVHMEASEETEQLGLEGGAWLPSISAHCALGPPRDSPLGSHLAGWPMQAHAHDNTLGMAYLLGDSDDSGVQHQQSFQGQFSDGTTRLWQRQNRTADFP